MRILHLTDHFPPVVGGIETHVAGLAERQAHQGHSVTVLTSTPRTAEGQTSTDVGPVEVRRVRSLLDGLRVDVHTFDLVHAHVSVVAPFTAPLVGVFARRGVPTVVTVHSLWSGMGAIPRVAATLTGMRGAPVTWSTVSRVAAAELRRHLLLGTPVHVIANAVEAPARPRTPQPDGEVRLVSTMRIARRKRPLELLRILDEVSRAVSVPGVSLTVVGDGPLRHRLEHRAVRLGLADRVRVTGRVAPTRVLRHLARSDVYVAPAVLESFGLAALEARGVGLPVVGRTATGLADFIDDGVEGLLCASDNDMVSALVELVEDRHLRLRMSEHNRRVAHGMSWSRSLATHERVYALARGRQYEAVLEP
ncbi:glycosyltransferase family 4 protein [Marmoricola sp. URHB0036]|uniref:glycosyltransferase family 4 protein n=1 Tax=Marmoricola sp. URHB0036 TaxID=1298863 RepID=UPI00041A7B62|nr:glycosyltransferase family 4 protein [Marmoricola sp. URHB0036]